MGAAEHSTSAYIRELEDVNRRALKALTLTQALRGYAAHYAALGDPSSLYVLGGLDLIIEAFQGEK